MAQILLPEGSAPSTPGAGNVTIYAKADGLVYSKDDAGTETLMSGGGTTDSQTLSNKTIALGSNTISGTKAQFDTACSDGDFAYLGQANTFTATQRISSGNLELTGTGQRITGDFSNATVANRVMFQTSTVNSTTSLGVIPNGTAQIAFLTLHNSSDPNNSSVLEISNQRLSGEARVASTITGTGTYLPMTFYTGGSERMRIDTSGNVAVTNAGGGLGYGTGAGGTVTQATSKSTAVTLNKPTGRITTAADALAAGASAVFIVNNSVCSNVDTVVVNVGDNANYVVSCVNTAVGAFRLRLTNITGGSLSEAVAINFTVIKGATS